MLKRRSASDDAAELASCGQAEFAMLAPHPCLARVLARFAGQNVALLHRIFLTQGTLRRLTGVWRRLGMLTQGRRWLILVLKTDLSSIQTTEQRPNLFPEFSMICM